MGTQFTIYLDTQTANKLADLQFGNSRSDKIRYCIRQVDPVVAAQYEALVIFNKDVRRFFEKNELWSAFDEFQFGDQA